MCGKKILIVDDAESIRLLLEITFEEEGYETIQADNARKALEIIESISSKIPALIW